MKELKKKFVYWLSIILKVSSFFSFFYSLLMQIESIDFLCPTVCFNYCWTKDCLFQMGIKWQRNRGIRSWIRDSIKSISTKIKFVRGRGKKWGERENRYWDKNISRLFEFSRLALLFQCWFELLMKNYKEQC